MNSQEMLEQLEALAQRMSIKTRYERCRSRGGLCRVKGKPMIIVRRSLTVPEKVDVLSRSLCRFPVEDYYLVPEVRKFLEETASGLRDSETRDLEEADDLEEEFADSE